MDDLGLVETGRRTGLTKHQLRYYERRGLLGPVARSDGGQRRYSAVQVRLLEGIGKLRALGVSPEEAAALAGDGVPGAPQVHSERLAGLIRQSVEEMRVSAQASLLLFELLIRRSGVR